MRDQAESESIKQQKIKKFRISQLQRITEIEQEIIMELFPGNYKPVKLPLQKRASFKTISQSKISHNQFSQIQVFQRLFQEEYSIFEASHAFWDLNKDSELSDNPYCEQKISQTHQNIKMKLNKASCQMKIESDNKEIPSQIFNNANQEDNTYSKAQQTKPTNLYNLKIEQEYSPCQFIKKEYDQQCTNKQNSFFQQDYVKKDILSCGQQRLDNSFSLSSFESNFIENIGKIDHSYSPKNHQKASEQKNKLKSKNADSSTKNQKVKSKIQYQSDESELNYKNQLSKKKNLKIERKLKERQKRSKYYERMAVKDQLQNNGEEKNELYVQSRDALINGNIFETFGIRNKFINSSHWLLGDSELNIKQRQEKAFNFLESFLNLNEKIPNNNNLKRIEILNVCSFVLQSTQIHKQMQQYFMNSQIQNFDDSLQQTSLPIQRNIFASNQMDKSLNENDNLFILNKSQNNQQKKYLNNNNNNQQHKFMYSESQLVKLEAQNSRVSQEESINALQLLNLTQIYYCKQLLAPQQNKQGKDEIADENQEDTNQIKNCMDSQTQQVNNLNSSKKSRIKCRLQKLLDQNFLNNSDPKEGNLKQNLLKFNQDNCEEIQSKKPDQQSQILFFRGGEEEEQFKKNQLNFKQQNKIEGQEENNIIAQNDNEITQKEVVSNLDQQEQKNYISNQTNNSQTLYSSIINKFFNLSFKNQINEDEFDFNNIKTSKSIYNNSDPSKKQFGIEVMVVNSEDEEIQIERIKKNYGKFHNFNKLFMYNVVKMFSECNLDNLGVPNMVIQEILNIVNKIKISARRRNNSNKEVQYDYFSIAHYNLLFFLIKNTNTEIVRNQFEYIHFYKKCFKINIQSDSQQQLSIIYANIIKNFCYLIYINSIQRSYKLAQQAQQKTPRQEYVLKATEGIQSLHLGNLVRRF
ncbi:hypothetical protein ABPG72_007972 [Tetrahymena utriculariae]